MAAFATLSLKKASCPNMSLKKAFAILALLAIIGFAQPAEGMESLYWWRVRYWNGKYYYVWQRKHKGWFDELDALEMESLQKAFKKDPSIKEWIHDRSNDGNWWNTDVETRPVWDDQLGVWRFPDPGVADDDWLSEASSLHTPEDIQSLKKAGGKATVGGSHPMSLEKAGGRAPHGGMSLHPQSLGKAHLVSGQKRIGNNGTTSSLIPGEGTWSGQGLQT